MTKIDSRPSSRLNSGSSSNVSPIFDTLALHFLVGHASGTVVAFIVMWTYMSDNSGSDNSLGPSLIPVLWWLQSSMSQHLVSDIVQVKLSSLKSVVNEFPCPKSQGEFLKVPVANVANMFSASLYLHEMYGTCVMCLYVVFNNVSAIFCIE